MFPFVRYFFQSAPAEPEPPESPHPDGLDDALLEYIDTARDAVNNAENVGQKIIKENKKLRKENEELKNLNTKRKRDPKESTLASKKQKLDEAKENNRATKEIIEKRLAQQSQSLTTVLAKDHGNLAHQAGAALNAKPAAQAGSAPQSATQPGTVAAHKPKPAAKPISAHPSKIPTLGAVTQPKTAPKPSSAHQSETGNLATGLSGNNGPKGSLKSTDAGEKPGSGRLSSTNLNAEEVRKALQRKSRLSRFPSNSPRQSVAEGETCFANAVLQALATAIDTYWLKEELKVHFDGTAGQEDRYNAVNQLIRALRNLRSTGKKAVDFTGFMQALASATKNDALSGDRQMDSEEFLGFVFDCLSQGAKFRLLNNHKLESENQNKLIDAMFFVEHHATLECSNVQCGDITRAEPPGNWVLRLGGSQNDDETTDIPNLLTDMTIPERILRDCDKCAAKEAIEAMQGLRRLPEILTLHILRYRFEQTHNRRSRLRYKVNVQENINLASWAPDDDNQRTRYALQSLITHRNGSSNSLDSGHYIAYTRREDGWWSCNGTTIRKLSEKEFKSICTASTEVVLTFYERLPAELPEKNDNALEDVNYFQDARKPKTHITKKHSQTAPASGSKA